MKELLLIMMVFVMMLSICACDSIENDIATTDTVSTQTLTEQATEEPTNKPTEKPTEIPTEKPTDKQIDTNQLYSEIAQEYINEYGYSWIDYSDLGCVAYGVIWIEILDFNNDGTEELMVSYNSIEEYNFAVIDIWTVKSNKAEKIFSGKSGEGSQAPVSFHLLCKKDGITYLRMTDDLGHLPVYDRLYTVKNGEFIEAAKYEGFNGYTCSDYGYDFYESFTYLISYNGGNKQAYEMEEDNMVGAIKYNTEKAISDLGLH